MGSPHSPCPHVSRTRPCRGATVARRRNGTVAGGRSHRLAGGASAAFGGTVAHAVRERAAEHATTRGPIDRARGRLELNPYRVSCRPLDFRNSRARRRGCPTVAFRGSQGFGPAYPSLRHPVSRGSFQNEAEVRVVADDLQQSVKWRRPFTPLRRGQPLPDVSVVDGCPRDKLASKWRAVSACPSCFSDRAWFLQRRVNRPSSGTWPMPPQRLSLKASRFRPQNSSPMSSRLTCS